MVKQFWKTSEFWLTIILILAAIAGFAFGKLSQADALALVGIGLGVGGYAVARGNAKALIVFGIFTSVWIGSGCAITANKKMQIAQDGLQTAQKLVEDGYHQKCTALAKKCEEAHDQTCAEWQQCNAMRQIVRQAFKLSRHALLDSME